MTARLARITIYPVKSLDGYEVVDATLLPSGGLTNDRRFALFDGDGQVINAKRFPAIQLVRSRFDARDSTLTVWTTEAAASISFDLATTAGQQGLAAWMSERLGVAVETQVNDSGGFPDDVESPGPTIVSAATLAAVAEWFPGLTVDEVRRRFRANLEIDGVEPFWEDRLYGPTGDVVPFTIGECQFLGVNPCARCPVPTRSSLTAEVWPGFAKQFGQLREETLPSWAERSRFDHFYRLAVNTRRASGQMLRVGDTVSL